MSPTTLLLQGREWLKGFNAMICTTKITNKDNKYDLRYISKDERKLLKSIENTSSDGYYTMPNNVLHQGTISRKDERSVSSLRVEM